MIQDVDNADITVLLKISSFVTTNLVTVSSRRGSFFALSLDFNCLIRILRKVLGSDFISFVLERGSR